LLISANRFDEVSQLAEMSQYLKNTARGCCGGQEKSFNDDIIRVFVVWFIILPRRSSRGFLFSAHLFPSAQRVNLYLLFTRKKATILGAQKRDVY